MVEFFPNIPKIVYKPDARVDETLAFKYYNASEIVLGRTMEEWLRFAVCFWHSFRGIGMDPFGQGTIQRTWDDGSDSLENHKRRLHAAFEFFTKLGVKYWTFHDRDIAPEGKTLDETNSILDEMTDLALELQKKTGVQLLWNTCNLFANPKYACGAATNPDAHVFATAAAQVKKGLEISKKLGALGFNFWGGREGYHTLLNTDINREMTNMANLYHMALKYREKIGFKGQMLIEPKPKEPTRHQYDYDAQTVMGFLRQFDLHEHFKLNIEPNHTTMAGHPYEHDVVVASTFGMLGSIDANTGSPDLGWDTDQFPMDIRACTAIMLQIIQQKGLDPGGLNFDAKVRRESTDPQDLFIAHIGAMDTFARALRIASKITSDGVMADLLKKRYASYETGLGLKIADGQATLEECEEYVRQQGNQQPKKISGQQEHYESIFNRYL